MFGGSALLAAKRELNPQQWVWHAEDRVANAVRELEAAKKELDAAKAALTKNR